MDIFNVFIIFPNEDSIEKFILCEETFDSYLGTIKDMIDRADCEKGVELFYDKYELSVFANALSDLIFVQDYLIDDPYILIDALLKNATDWQENLLHQTEYFYGLWNFDSRFVEQKFPPSVKEATEHKKTSTHTLLLNLSFDFQKNRQNLYILKDFSDFQEEKMPYFIKLEQVHDLETIEKWFSTNRIPRKLDFDDERHNERSSKYIKSKSPILYDFRYDKTEKINISIVQNLLDNAFGDQNAEHHSKDLMNYDTKTNRYIWFEYENDNPQNLYHAYHLAIPKTHDEDKSAIERIPKRAKRFIDLKRKK